MELNAILHPLASATIETQEWLNQLPRIPSYIEACGFQSACLDESVYISQNFASSFGNECVLHKCSMKDRSYDKLLSRAEGYALAVYRSKVLMIGGRIPSSSNDVYPKKPISVLHDSSLEESLLHDSSFKLEESLNSAMKDLYKIGRNACAVGDGDFLIVIGGDGPREETILKNDSQEYVRVFDGQNWYYGAIAVPAESTFSADIGTQRKCLVLVFQDRLYMTAYDATYSRTNFYYISLDCFKNQLDPQTTLTCTWNRLENVPDCARYTNLSVVGNQLVTVGIDGGFMMYAYLATSATWIGVHEFQPPVMLHHMAGIIGLPGSSSDHVEALLVGVDHTQLTHIFKVTTKCELILHNYYYDPTIR